MINPYRLLVEILLGSLSLSLIVFGVAYYFRSNWRATKVGRYVLYFMMTLAATFSYLFFNTFFEQYPGRYVISVILGVALNIVSWGLVWVLLKIQRDGNNKEVRDNDVCGVPERKDRAGREF